MNALERYRSDLLGMGLTRGTIAVYMGHARKYLAGLPDEQEAVKDPHEVLAYMGKMREENVSPNTRQVAFYALKAFLASLDVDMKFKPPKDPERRSDPHRPYFTRPEVLDLIGWAKKEGAPRDKALLALSTTYGLRRTELCGILAEDVAEDRITIWTAKQRGAKKPRVHKLPPQIAPLCHEYREWGSLSETAMSQEFKVILSFATGDYQGQTGWHAIRRSLATELRKNGADILAIRNFMRWKGGMTGMEMPSLYIQLNDPDVDEEIFNKHPFLEAWE